MNDQHDSFKTELRSAFLPGERVHIDVVQVKRSRHLYFAVDDCSRFVVISLFSRTSEANSITFLNEVLASTTFAVRGIQTKRREAFGVTFQQELRGKGIEFSTDQQKVAEPLIEEAFFNLFYENNGVFCSNFPELKMALKGWQNHYNFERPHGCLDGKVPMQVICELDPTNDEKDFFVVTRLNEGGMCMLKFRAEVDDPLLEEKLLAWETNLCSTTADGRIQ